MELRCTACGGDNPPGNRFCITCGSVLASLCPACGQSNPPQARFCGGCGLALEEPPGPGPATDRTPASATSASERRLVSVLFSDLVGFTTFAEDRDPEAVRDLLSRYFETTTGIVQRHGGTVEKFIGDAVMAVWGTPIAHEDDAERAVRAALEVVDAVKTLQPELQARVGVLTGEAAVALNAQNQGMVAGDLVNTAARLQGVAEPGTVLVGETTMRAAERSIVFEPIGDHSLKGKTSPVPAWQALRVVAARGGQGRADSLEPPFVGRDEELRQLKEVLHAVGRERRPRLVSITGPGGIGKSRLVWELDKYVDGVAETIYWHRGRSPSYGEGITFWALGEMVRRRAQLTEDDDEATTRGRIAATLEEYIADAGERDRIGAALLSLLGTEAAPSGGRDELFPAWRLFFERIAERGTTVLVFEDLQWADTGTLDFVDHLLDWSRALPLMVVTLARPELFEKRPDWAAGRRHLTALALEPLTDAAIREMLDALVPGLPDDALAAIVGRAEGVPLYAVETVRGLLADGRIERRGEAYVPVGDLSQLRVPDSLRSLIASRLDGLDVPDRGLLQDASVLGQVFAADALRAISGLEPDDLAVRLRSLVRRELLDVERDPSSPERGQYKFVQAVIREVAYGTLSRRDRRARHLAVARHYERLGDDELAGALANHYLAAHGASEAGPEADAIATQARLALGAAAARAAALGAHENAIAYLDQALAVTADPRDRAPLLDRAAISASAAASLNAERYARAAVDAYREVGDRAAAAAATARLGRTLLDASQVPRATEVLEAALPQAESLDDDSALAATLANLARAYMRAGAAAKSVEVADRALPIAERLNLDEIVAEAFANKGASLHHLGRRRESVALQTAALELAQRIGNRSMEMRIRHNLAGAVADDDPVRATTLVLDAMDLARDIGNRAMFYWLAGTATVALLGEGRDWDQHAAVLREAYETATIRFDRLRLRNMLGVFDTIRGERLAELAAEMTGLVGDSADPDERFLLEMALGGAALASGDFSSAYESGMRAVELSTTSDEPGLFLAMSAAISARRPDRIRTVAPLVAALPGTGAWMRAFKRYADAALAAIEDRTGDAVGGFVSASDELSALGLRFDAATIAVDAAVLLPDQPEIRELAARVRPLLEELRARPYLERLDAALASVTPADHQRTVTAADRAAATRPAGP